MTSFYPRLGTLSHKTFIVTTCALDPAATILIYGRFYLRRRRGKLAWDDAFSGIALASLIAFSTMINLDDNLNVTSGDAAPGETYFPTMHKYVLVSNMLAWVVLYSVKAAFLALCLTIFGVAPAFRKVWWAISGYTFVTFWAILLAQLWQCGDPSSPANGYACTVFQSSQSYLQYTSTVTEMAFGLHISSDLLILAMPITMLSKLRMSPAQKTSVGCVFLLIIINISMGIMRLASFIILYKSTPEPSRFTRNTVEMMAICEPSVAVMICALPAYWVLLPTVRKRNRPRQHQWLEMRQQKLWDQEQEISPPGRALTTPRISTLPPISTFAVKTGCFASTQKMDSETLLSSI